MILKCLIKLCGKIMEIGLMPHFLFILVIK